MGNGWGMETQCKFCGALVLVKTSGGEFMLKPGEKFLAMHDKPDSTACVMGSGLTLRDNEKRP